MIELEENVCQWAYERGILAPDNDRNQLIKTMEELGEVADATLKGDHEGIKDGIGDVLVCLTIFARQNGLSLVECYEHAYSEIKDRTGKTVNGTFIKNE